MIRRYNRLDADNTFLEIRRLNPSAGPASGKTTCGPVDNLSRGGLRFHSSEPFDVDERVEITLHLGNGETHCATGRICYCIVDKDNPGLWSYGISILDNFLEPESSL